MRSGSAWIEQCLTETPSLVPQLRGDPFARSTVAQKFASPATRKSCPAWNERGRSRRTRGNRASRGSSGVCRRPLRCPAFAENEHDGSGEVSSFRLPVERAQSHGCPFARSTVARNSASGATRNSSPAWIERGRRRRTRGKPTKRGTSTPDRANRRCLSPPWIEPRRHRTLREYVPMNALQAGTRAWVPACDAGSDRPLSEAVPLYEAVPHRESAITCPCRPRGRRSRRSRRPRRCRRRLR